MIRTRVVVSGQVQGVFFRDTCRRLALARGITGWVRNLPDGRVEAVFEGDDAGVAALVAWAARGPRGAMVQNVTTVDEVPQGIPGFEIRPTPH